jgi:hypothetical protein
MFYYWNKFWFAPQSPVILCVFRIVFGLLVLESCYFMAPNLLTFFSEHGVLSTASSMQLVPLPYSNVLAWLNPTDQALRVFFGIFVLSAICLTLGFMTRLSCIIVYVGLVLMQHRDCLVMNSGDFLMRLMSFYLILAPAGARLSVDSGIRALLKKERSHSEGESLWALRLMQMQMAAIYFEATWTKLQGASWQNGSALFYVFHEQEFLRFPIAPFLKDNLLFCQILSWGTIVVEALLFSLVWFKKFRYWVLSLGVLLHLGIEYAMNLPIFQWLMISGLFLFVHPRDFLKLIAKVRKSWRKPAANA